MSKIQEIINIVTGKGWTNKQRIRLAAAILNQVPEFNQEDFDTFFYDLDEATREELVYQLGEFDHE